ncbi:MAG: T9SS type A sorting domain-containing protein [Balneolaceae bacterium]
MGQPLLEVQRDFENGKIDVEAAALEQFRILFEAKQSPHQKREIIKCATPAFAFLHRHKNELSQATLNEIEEYRKKDISRKSLSMQESYISESGKFEIFYEISGSDSVSITDGNGNDVPDYVEWVGEAADSSYRHEVINIGFTDPIPAGYRYEIFLRNMSFYGLTSDNASGYPCTSNIPETCIYIENDFIGFPANTDPEGHTKGAIKATMAHEVKHAIQYAQNQWRSPAGTVSWTEMDATLMEEVVYDDVNDYYNYIKNGFNSSVPNSLSIFAEPQRSVPGAYWYVSWMIYFSEAFGNDVWREVWELIEAENNLGIDAALTVALSGRNISFDESFVQNHLWHFASGDRAGENDYGFDEKHFYPKAVLEESFTEVPEEQISMGNLNKLAARYFEIIPSSLDQGLIEAAIDFDSTQVGLGLLFYMNDGHIVETIVTGKNKAQVYIPTEIEWQEISRLGVVVANPDLLSRTESLSLSFGKNGNPVTIRDPDYADLPEAIMVFQNYPNPFNPETIIRFELPNSAFVELEVYDITGRIVHTLIKENRRFGRYNEVFDGSALASGVYIYRLRIDDEIFIKKMTLIK